MLEYSPWKIAHHKDKLEQLKRGEIVYPVSLKICLTNLCNRTCTFCFESTANAHFASHLETQRVLTLLEEAKELGVKSIEITGGGEPTAHKDFHLILKKINELGFDYGLVTNGTLLKDKIIEDLQNASWIRFSINARTPEKYKEVMGGVYREKFETDWRKIATFEKPVVGASFVITKDNFKEILPFTKWIKDMGFNNVRFTPERTETSIHPALHPIWDECSENLKEAKKLQDKKFTVFSMEDRMVSLDSVSKPFSSCYYQHFVAAVWTTGDIYPCMENRNNLESAFGNIYSNSLKEIWDKKAAIGISQCKIPCLNFNMNSFTDYIMKENPKHVNFV